MKYLLSLVVIGVFFVSPALACVQPDAMYKGNQTICVEKPIRIKKSAHANISREDRIVELEAQVADLQKQVRSMQRLINLLMAINRVK